MLFCVFHLAAIASVNGPYTPSHPLFRPLLLSAFCTACTSSPRIYGETRMRFRGAVAAEAPAIISHSCVSETFCTLMGSGRSHLLSGISPDKQSLAYPLLGRAE